MDSKKRTLLIGCGTFAAQAHLPALSAARDFVRVSAVVDLAEREPEVRETCRRFGLGDDLQFIGLAAAEGSATGDLRAPEVDGVIVSTPTISHGEYIAWALERRYPTLVDKPLTVSGNCSRDPESARSILSDFHGLTRMADGTAPFMLATQRRYQPVYRRIARFLNRTHASAGYPVTFVQCLTNDGLWHHVGDYADQHTYHPRRSGGGKLVHTGYHVLDLVPWLMRHCRQQNDPDPAVGRIRTAEVFATTFHPVDSAAMAAPGDSPADELDDLAEINAGLQIAFRDAGGRVVTIVQIAALHEGLSLNSRQNADPQARTEAANRGRTKQDVLSIYQGPVGAVWLRRIAKLKTSEGSGLGEANHLDLVLARNPNTGDTAPTLERDSLSYEACDSAPTAEFLTHLGKHASGSIVSPVSDHSIPVKLLSAAYESAATGRPVVTEFTAEEWGLPPGSADYLD